MALVRILKGPVAYDADDYAVVERGMQLADLRWHWGDAYER